MARKQIERLIEKSGGYGTYLLMGVDWAPYPATERSHQLFAEEVIPHFNGSLKPMQRSFDDVMSTAREVAQSGDVVLLSPACSSYDMFDNYEQRGAEFKPAIRWART